MLYSFPSLHKTINDIAEKNIGKPQNPNSNSGEAYVTFCFRKIRNQHGIFFLSIQTIDNIITRSCVLIYVNFFCVNVFINDSLTCDCKKNHEFIDVSMYKSNMQSELWLMYTLCITLCLRCPISIYIHVRSNQTRRYSWKMKSTCIYIRNSKINQLQKPSNVTNNNNKSRISTTYINIFLAFSQLTYGAYSTS